MAFGLYHHPATGGGDAFGPVPYYLVVASPPYAPPSCPAMPSSLVLPLTPCTTYHIRYYGLWIGLLLPMALHFNTTPAMPVLPVSLWLPVCSWHACLPALYVPVYSQHAAPRAMPALAACMSYRPLYCSHPHLPPMHLCMCRMLPCHIYTWEGEEHALPPFTFPQLVFYHLPIAFFPLPFFLPVLRFYG